MNHNDLQKKDKLTLSDTKRLGIVFQFISVCICGQRKTLKMAQKACPETHVEYTFSSLT